MTEHSATALTRGQASSDVGVMPTASWRGPQGTTVEAASWLRCDRQRTGPSERASPTAPSVLRPQGRQGACRRIVSTLHPGHGKKSGHSGGYLGIAGTAETVGYKPIVRWPVGQAGAAARQVAHVVPAPASGEQSSWALPMPPAWAARLRTVFCAVPDARHPRRRWTPFGVRRGRRRHRARWNEFLLANVRVRCDCYVVWLQRSSRRSRDRRRSQAGAPHPIPCVRSTFARTAALERPHHDCLPCRGFRARDTQTPVDDPLRIVETCSAKDLRVSITCCFTISLFSSLSKTSHSQ